MINQDKSEHDSKISETISQDTINHVSDEVNHLYNISVSLAKEAKLDDVLVLFKDNPSFVGLWVYKLLQEKQEQSKVIRELCKKYELVQRQNEEMLFLLKQNQQVHNDSSQKEFKILSEQDNKILDFVEKQGKASANDIQGALNYKGQNGASARLNKLTNEGHLKKIRAGKQVYFIMH